MRFGLLAWWWISAVAVGAVQAVPPSSPPGPDEEMVRIEYRRVLEVSEGRLVLGAGTQQGFFVGKSVRIFRPLAVPDPEKPEATHELMAIVRVERAEAETSEAVLGRGEEAAVGDWIDLTMERPTATTSLPVRGKYTYRIGASVRPMFGGENGFGVLLGGFVSYRIPQAPLFSLMATLEPLSLGLGFPPALRLTGLAGYSGSFYELMAGLGVMPPTPGCGTNCGVPVVTLNLQGRVGAIDGLSLTAGTGLSLLGSYTAFVPVSFFGEVTLAPTREIGFFLRGDLSATFEQSGQAGVRLYTQGVGHSGTIIYTVSAGFLNSVLGGVSSAGVTLGAGVEFRL